MENANETKKDPADTEGIPALPCNKLADNPLRFPFYSETHIGELAGSIKEVGLLEPVLVCKTEGGNYTILSGHYRVRAVRRLLQKTVPCRVVECDRRQLFLIYCTSNILVRGLAPLEEAHMISVLSVEEKYTLEEIGRIWGRSKSWASRRLGLMTRLDPAVTKDLGAGRLSPRIAQELMRLPRGNAGGQERALAVIRKRRMNKEEAAEFVTWWAGAGETERKTAEAGGFPFAKVPEDTFPGETAACLRKCTGLLDRLIGVLGRTRGMPAWPSDLYLSFRKASEHLEAMLAERLVAGKEAP